MIKRFEHSFFLWIDFLQIYFMQSLNFNFCYLIEEEIKHLHRRFGHFSFRKLQSVLENSKHEINKTMFEKFTRFCIFCQKHDKSSKRFKFILREKINFNFSIIVNIMYIDNNSILHVIDESTKFQTVKWLKEISAKNIWKMLKLCWIDVYLKSPDFIHHDAGKNFINREFRQYATLMAIIIKAVPVEVHWSIEIVERFHSMLKRAYKVIMKDLAGNIEIKVSKKLNLQMIVKTVNDTAETNGLVFTLFVFDAYSRMHHLDFSASNITQRAAVITKAMKKMKKMIVEKQIRNVLNIRNGSIVNHFHDLPLNSEVLVWKKKQRE